jgi:vacuolar-type H+-ATPase subunit H
MGESGASGASSGPATVEVLKRLKEVETAAESQVRLFVEEGERMLRALRSEADAAVAAARVELEKTREATLQAERAKVERDAERLLEEGRKAAESLDAKGRSLLDSRREPLLNAVLPEFRPSGAARPGR